MTERAFIPAAGHDWLLPLYDPLQTMLGGDTARAAMIQAAQLAAGHRVLDIGCGTGSLVAALAHERADVAITGLDPDPKALARARRKTQGAGAEVRLDQGFSEALPYGDAAFDRVFSTFMFHHLALGVKQQTLAEARRVLAPGGELHLLDFAHASDAHDAGHGLFAKLLHPPKTMQENASAAIVGLLSEAGFAGAAEVSHRRTLFGRVGHFRGVVPQGS